MARQGYSIGELARAGACALQTVRHYEQIGLMPQAARNDGNQRRYGAADLRRLLFIRHARELGFELPAIRELLDLSGHPNEPCAAADQIAARHLAAVEDRIARLGTLRDELHRMVGACAGGTVAECRVIEVLADHGQCGGHTDASAESLLPRRGGERRG